MTRRPHRLVRVLSSALAAGTLLTTAACSDDGGTDGSRVSGVTASQAAGKRQTPSPTTLTTDRARTALITEADIEDDWTQVKDTEAGNWHDSLLIGRVDVSDFLTAKAQAADCRRLLGSLFDDELLGRPSGASALRGFTQGDSRLLYQVASYERADPQDSLNWMANLPEKCDRFTVTDGGDQRTVEVVETSLPGVGDAREGLRVTVRGTTGGTEATLTLDVAAVRVGEDAITVTAGGLDGDENDSVEQAVRLGTQRLKDVLAGRTPSPNPGEVQ
jgi:type V secretory pathway adhesin AidA